MSRRRQPSQKIEFGDFQTPPTLAGEVCRLLARMGLSPASILEPTCGQGAFLGAALGAFPDARVVRGFDCNPSYVRISSAVVAHHPNARVVQGDFFEVDWDGVLADLPDPMLVVGNPPWVTNATVGSLGGNNLPQKSNVDRLRGIDALTGRSNFDISESMLRETMRWLDGRDATMAVLCKTAVARKVLLFAWGRGVRIKSSAIHRIDALKEFGASVDACLLVVRFEPDSRSAKCDVHESLQSTTPSSRFGMSKGRLVSDVEAYDHLAFLHGEGLVGWRSGVKHDCSRVFEFTKKEGTLVNGLGESVSIEADVVFPLLKSSDVVRGREPRKRVLIPHRSMEESPADLQSRAPAAWKYLVSHAEILDKRGSTIHKKRPRFSIFGIGAYSLAPWKVAISGLYKELTFARIGPCDGRPVMLDDTCYLFPCNSQQECDVLHELVSCPVASEFWSSLIFWDAKRPITSKLLNALDLSTLAKHLDCRTPTTRRLAERQRARFAVEDHQAMLF